MFMGEMGRPCRSKVLHSSDITFGWKIVETTCVCAEVAIRWMAADARLEATATQVANQVIDVWTFDGRQSYCVCLHGDVIFCLILPAEFRWNLNIAVG